jgi:hypothetical protein
MPSPQAYNNYINWIIYAIVGRPQEGDDLMRREGSGIRSVAKHLLKIRKPRITTLYRGLLLNPEESEDRIIEQDPHLTYVSFSENRDVACWFADPDSTMSGLVKEIRPDVEGWVMEYTPKLSDILFHYSWDPLPLPGGRDLYLEEAASMHPHIAEDQLAWNLHSQSEVITKPLRAGTPIEAHELSNCPPTRELDREFTWPPLRRRLGL